MNYPWNSVIFSSRVRVALFFSVLALGASEPLLFVDFNDHSPGPYTQAMAEADFPNAQWYMGMEQGRGEIVQGAQEGEQALRMVYPGNTFGPHENGIQIKAVLSETVDTAWAVYTVRFEEGFDFVRGGKLPGLCGGDCITGGQTPDGTNGWSARIMWRSEGDGVQYVYLPDHRAADFPWNYVLPQKRFEPEKWHTVVTRIIMNTPGESDGSIYSWFDGELSLVREDLTFRDIEELAIDVFYISTFFGGSSQDWAPPYDVYAEYGSFLVSQDQATPKPQALFSTSHTTGVVPFAVGIDSRMSLGRDLSYRLEFGSDGVVSDSAVDTKKITAPGIYTLAAQVTDSLGQTSRETTTLYALDSLDAIASTQWQGVDFQDTLADSEKYLNMRVTILDTGSTVYVGPAIREDVDGEWHLFGSLRIQDGLAAALNGDTREYDTAHGVVLEDDSITVSFRMNYDEMTYSVWIDDEQIGGAYPYRGYSLAMSHYGIGADSDYAARISQVGTGYSRELDEPVRLHSVVDSSRPLSRPDYSLRAQGMVLSFTHFGSAEAKVHLYDPAGKALTSFSAQGVTPVELSLPAKGVYVYRVETEGRQSTGSFRVSP
ncbi:polysaccharide lyase [Chitinivibrio alkaliphilus]|uniref:Polysaccharide lyase family protein n=1 Tax=Chitinivibrio alkaliphilus ACht1 TaxID=1313304 RepID=U7DBW0_9BACT|nr:polysaccharide lyase family protein [Chitinivibrio alkaliphilus]ERP39068.1 polysaccharide lyase family protein [Chitinivibrio alkaliphilus ACht1]